LADVSDNGERWEFKVGVPVEARDGPIGHLRQVILNPGDGRVTALVLRRTGLPARELVVPVDAVAHANDDGVRLKLTKEEVMNQPLLQREQYVTPTTAVPGYAKDQALFSLAGGPRGGEPSAEGWTGSQAAAIRAGQRVKATDGDAGKVDIVLVDSTTRRATHFTIRKGLLLGKDVLVPVEWIAECRPDVIKLAVDKATLEHLPPYRPDVELEGDVEDALWKDPLLGEGVLTVSEITVAVRDGKVTLLGHVRQVAQKQHAEKITAGVPGVLSVTNFLYADDELEQAVIQALSSDPRTRGLSIRVYSWLGKVHLDGEVPTQEARTAAQEITARVPGVDSVVNLLSVTGVPSPWQQDRLRELSTGQPVYVEGAVLGQVEKLLVDPRTWQVTALVVCTNRLFVSGGAGDEAIVVPITDVERVTAGAVYLSLTEEAARRLPRFDPAAYPAPDQDWPPPLPYRREDIALDLTPNVVPTHQPGAAGPVPSSSKTRHGL
jgi:osmotically-inducible protein OsmY/sporulation protein YlmC with PRC-barrel domain